MRKIPPDFGKIDARIRHFLFFNTLDLGWFLRAEKKRFFRRFLSKKWSENPLKVARKYYRFSFQQVMKLTCSLLVINIL